MGGTYQSIQKVVGVVLIISQHYKNVLGDNFELITAFSREGPNKVYVQHRLKERAKEVNELLEKKAYIYVCGDAANMAREVNTVLAQIIAEQRGLPEAKGEEIVKNMRAANQYQVRNDPDPLLWISIIITNFSTALVAALVPATHAITWSPAPRKLCVQHNCLIFIPFANVSTGGCLVMIQMLLFYSQQCKRFMCTYI